jgi:serine/threonine-protein kinase RsbW
VSSSLCEPAPDGVARQEQASGGADPRYEVTPRQTVQTFERAPRGGFRARHVVGDCLDAWGLSSERETFELVVSELFTNAVRHGDGAVSVGLSFDGDVIRVEVADEGGGRPVIRPLDVSGDAPGGWGLRLVGQLSDDWGADVGEGRTVVWAERAVHD